MYLRRHLLWVVACFWCVPVYSQLREESPVGPATISTQRWRFGVVLVSSGGALHSLTATVTVPMDWPDQRVRVVEEDLSPGVKYSFQAIGDLGRQMVVKVPHLSAGSEARAVLTFEVKRVCQPPPQSTEGFVVPDPKKLDRKLAPFLAPSPYIESNSTQVKTAAGQIVAGKERAWERVKAIYDWVQEKVKYEDNQGKRVLSAVEAMQSGKGDCDEITSLFVALCRAAGIPARTVRVPRHVYPEFYLLDDQGQGRWFPCQSAGTPSFGYMPDLRPILQRGDNVLLPDPRTKKRTRYRYFPENVTGFPVGAGGAVQHKLVCEMEK